MLFGMKKEKKRAGDMQGIVHALEDERGKLCSPGQETRKELCMLYKMKAATCCSLVHWQTCLLTSVL